MHSVDNPHEPSRRVQFDYPQLAWVVDGVYVVSCRHALPCKCFGRIHAGEPAKLPRASESSVRDTTPRGAR